MSRPVTLFTGQWADLPLEDICRKASDFGYQGLELACWGDHFEINKAIADPSYCSAKRDLLDRYDLWDHVAYCNPDTGGVILQDTRLRLCRYKASLYLDRGEVFPEAIQAALARPGEGLILEDPRGVMETSGRVVPVRAVQTRSERLKDAVDQAYLDKYDGPGSIKYARDLGRAKSRATTTELVPR